MKIDHSKKKYFGLITLAIIALVFLIFTFFIPNSLVIDLRSDLLGSVATTSAVVAEGFAPEIKKEITHIKTPEAVKAIYMTACVAGTPSFRAKLLKLAKETEINSIVVDIKDYTGTISFEIDNPIFKGNLGGGCRVKDMVDFVDSLHKNNIYVIGRITAFQDPYITKVHPDWAVKKKSDKSVVWKDRKGISFADAGAKPMWEYLTVLAKESYAVGFDEINFDYIRFPSDGDMKDIYFPWSNDALIANAKPFIATSTSSTTQPIRSGKSIVLKGFFEYLHENLGPAGIPISADLFGMTATNYDDLNIGQILEYAAPNFDFICPMVYPSHYPVGFMGYKSVAEVNAHAYEIVNYSMKIAAERLKAIGEDPLKLRPWLQDNDYPVPYTPAMVRAQIKATYDAGLTSWLLWDAGNTYTQSALLVE